MNNETPQNPTLKPLGVVLIIFAVILFLAAEGFYFSGRFKSKNETDLTGDPSKSRILTGAILCTADVTGYYEPAGCERFGSLTRRAALLNHFKNYLYLDAGHFTSDKLARNKAVAPFMETAYALMKLDAMNLTKHDMVNLYKIQHENLLLDYVSANLRIQAPGYLKNCLRPFKLIPFRLTCRSSTKDIRVGITGITDNERQIHPADLKFTVEDIEQSLKQVAPHLEPADIKILLFNDSFFKLEQLIRDKHIRFDLVIARATVPDLINRMLVIGDTTIVFPDEYGRTLGYIAVTREKNKYNFGFKALIPGMGTREDGIIARLVHEMEMGFDDMNHNTNNNNNQNENQAKTKNGR